jgi:hypothetical protein
VLLRNVTNSFYFNSVMTALPESRTRSRVIHANSENPCVHDPRRTAQAELVGKAVVLTDGKAGTVEIVWLDEMHGLRISISGRHGKWPISTIKFAQPG